MKLCYRKYSDSTSGMPTVFNIKQGEVQGELMGKLHESQGGYQDQVQSDQMVLVIVGGNWAL
jgi:hypothetical protein